MHLITEQNWEAGKMGGIPESSLEMKLVGNRRFAVRTRSGLVWNVFGKLSKQGELMCIMRDIKELEKIPRFFILSN